MICLRVNLSLHLLEQGLSTRIPSCAPKPSKPGRLRSGKFSYHQIFCISNSTASLGASPAVCAVSVSTSEGERAVKLPSSSNKPLVPTHKPRRHSQSASISSPSNTNSYKHAPNTPSKTDIVQELRGVAVHRKNAPPLSDRIAEILTRYPSQSPKAWAQSLRSIALLPSKGPEIATIVLDWILENVEGGVTARQCGNVLVGAGRAGDADVIERVFKLMKRCNLERTTQQYNMLLSVYVRVGRPEDAFTLFHKLTSANGSQPSIINANDSQPSSTTTNGSEPSFVPTNKAQASPIPTNRSQPSVIPTNGSQPSTVPANRFQPSIVTFNTLIAACGSVPKGAARVRALMSAMTSAGVSADVITYNAALKVVGAKGLVREAESLLAEMKAAGVRPTDVTYLALINMYGRVPGGLPRAEEIYRQMLRDPIVRPETPQLSAMMSAYAREGDWEGTQRVFQDLVSRGLKPDHMVFVARLTAHGNARRGSSVRAVFAEMQSAGLTPNFITWTAFVDALARCGELSEAKNALRDMTSSGIPPDVTSSGIPPNMTSSGIRPTARSFTVLFDAYVTSGRLQEGAGLLTRMVREFRCKPNVGIYTVQIGHLCNVAAYDEAAKVFREMLQVGIRPELHTYVTLMSAMCTLLEKESATSAEVATSAGVAKSAGRKYGATSAAVRTLLDAIGSCDELLYRATHSLLDPSRTPADSKTIGLVDRVDGLTYQQQCDFFSQLIGALWFARLRERAATVFRAAYSGGVFCGAFSTRGKEWSVDMHRVSPGVAQLMLVLWLRELGESVRGNIPRSESAEQLNGANDRLVVFETEQRENGRLALPRSVTAITGWGKHSAGEGEAVVGKAVGDLIEELGAPFEPLRLGSYTATWEDLSAWFDQPGTAEKLALKDA